MPLHDFVCVACGHVQVDVYRSIAEGAMAHPPVCPECGEPSEWVPAIGSMDAFEPGTEFTAYDGQNNPVHVESFAQMRKLERESEQQMRNGEGQPIRFRHLHQDRSNRDVNTFGEAPSSGLTAEGKKKFGLRGAATQHGATEPERAYGPGVHDGNTSMLDHLKK